MSYPWPTTAFPVVRSRFYVDPHTRATTSPLNRATLADRLAGERWVAELEMAPMDEPTQRRLQAFLSRLDGQVGRVYIGPTSLGGYAGPRSGAIASSAVVAFSDGATFSDGSSFGESRSYGDLFAIGVRGADSLVVEGLIGNQTIERGDIIQVGDPYSGTGCQLLEIIEDARTIGAGRSRVNVRPRLRADYRAGTIVTLINPRGVFQLADDQQNAVDRRLFVATHSIRLVEVVSQ